MNEIFMIYTSEMPETIKKEFENQTLFYFVLFAQIEISSPKYIGRKNYKSFKFPGSFFSFASTISFIAFFNFSTSVVKLSKLSF